MGTDGARMSTQGNPGAAEDGRTVKRVTCPSCEANWPLGTMFCGTCGASLRTAVATSTPATPASPPAPVRSAAPLRPRSPGGAPSIPTASIFTGMGAAAILVGSFLDWFKTSSGPTIHAFRVPVEFLFDRSPSNENPDVGTFTVILAALVVLGVLAPQLRGLGQLAGLLAAVAGILFFVQVGESAEGTGSSFTDFTGAGPWVVIGGGLLALLAPFGLRSAPGPRSLAPDRTEKPPPMTM